MIIISADQVKPKNRKAKKKKFDYVNLSFYLFKISYKKMSRYV